ncbi:hypothetical protein ShirakiTB12_03020 [Priestia megaterium]|uniref:Antitoxin SocA-like Panacea domain-containing protein n=1 Tax=Priestia megaterium TaxID=1404 RepID=A0AAX6BDJ0_PRIMG|nr:type II toxin-antitoxin system antitoxin SocA domain-containing protein [Priestia megaterium]GMG71834.1 hypothetical protein ShirakiTB12_03020 [Priestia megaterium]
MSKSAFDFAKHFINQEYDHPRNTFDGNMKLQKMLYFSQLIHLATKGEKLFEDNMYAFKNGTVVESVRQRYYHDTTRFIEEASQSEMNFSEREMESVLLAEQIFGELDAGTLSDLNHQQQSWISCFERSKDPFHDNFYHKEASIIDVEDIKALDLDSIREVIDAFYESTEESDDAEVFEIVNGKKFYYNPSEIHINEPILEVLQNFEGEESVYSIYKDESNSYVIF